MQEQEPEWSPAGGLGLPSPSSAVAPGTPTPAVSVPRSARARGRVCIQHILTCRCTLGLRRNPTGQAPTSGPEPAVASNSAHDAVLAPAGNSTAEETCTSAACRQLRIKDVRAKVTPKEIAEAPLVGRVPYDTFPARSAGPDGPLPDFPGRFMQSPSKPSSTLRHPTKAPLPVWRPPCPPHAGRQAAAGGARALEVTMSRGRTRA